MRKLGGWIAALFVCALYGSPVGNPSTSQLLSEGFFISPDSWFGVRAGYEGDFVYDGRLKQQRDGNGRVDSYKQDTNSGTIALNVLDRMDLYGVLGSSRTKADWRFSSGASTLRAELETGYRFLWGVGGRVIFLEWGKADLGFGGRYSSCNYRPAWLTLDGAPVSTSGARIKWREWQVDLDLSYKIDLFTPYIGIKYSDVTTKLGPFSTAIASNGSGRNRFTNRVHVGFFVGCSLTTGKYFMLNLEGRFADEEAVTVSGDLRF